MQLSLRGLDKFASKLWTVLMILDICGQKFASKLIGRRAAG